LLPLCFWPWEEKRSVNLHFNTDEKNINEVLASVGVKPVPSIVKQIVDSSKGKKVEQV
jgi:hypothetical protein